MLNPWNPLSPFRLLAWLLLEPARLADYRARAGEQSSKIVGSWLTSSLTWLPMLIPLLGYGLGSIPGASSGGLYLAGCSSCAGWRPASWARAPANWLGLWPGR